MRISIFITCLADTLFPETGRAVVRLLERLGHEEIAHETGDIGEGHEGNDVAGHAVSEDRGTMENGVVGFHSWWW